MTWHKTCGEHRHHNCTWQRFWLVLGYGTFIEVENLPPESVRGGAGSGLFHGVYTGSRILFCHFIPPLFPHRLQHLYNYLSPSIETWELIDLTTWESLQEIQVNSKKLKVNLLQLLTYPQGYYMDYPIVKRRICSSLRLKWKRRCKGKTPISQYPSPHLSFPTTEWSSKKLRASQTDPCRVSHLGYYSARFKATLNADHSIVMTTSHVRSTPGPLSLLACNPIT